MEQITFDQARERLFRQLGQWKIMALACAGEGRVTVRNVSCLIYDGAIWFKTDKNFPKTQLLLAHPQAALCWNGVQVEGTAQCMGLVAEEPEQKFETLYRRHLWGSYNHHSHQDTEILIRIVPEQAEIWDTDEENYAFQLLLDFPRQQVELIPYDHREEEAHG